MLPHLSLTQSLVLVYLSAPSSTLNSANLVFFALDLPRKSRENPVSKIKTLDVHGIEDVVGAQEVPVRALVVVGAGRSEPLYHRDRWLPCARDHCVLLHCTALVIRTFLPNNGYRPAVDAVYFAIVSLTTVGYGDIGPHGAPAKVTAMPAFRSSAGDYYHYASDRGRNCRFGDRDPGGPCCGASGALARHEPKVSISQEALEKQTQIRRRAKILGEQDDIPLEDSVFKKVLYRVASLMPKQLVNALTPMFVVAVFGAVVEW